MLKQLIMTLSKIPEARHLSLAISTKALELNGYFIHQELQLLVVVKISSAIELNTLSHGSHIFRSNISTEELTGLNKILFQILCRKLAILVGVPTADESIIGVTFVVTAISSAAQSAITSSTLLY